jgi:hypothetical protein
MSEWSPGDLERIASAEELDVASRRSDGTLSSYVTIWVVRVGDDVYIRSAYGPNNPWFRNAKARGRGRIRAGGVECDVEFTPPPAGVHQDIDAAYHAKYDNYGPQLVSTVVGRHAAPVTFRLVPAGATA